MCGDSMVIVVLLAFCMLSVSARALAPSPDETTAARHWMETAFGEAAPAPPFSFTCGGRSSAELLKTWKLERATSKLDDQRTQYTLTWTDPETGLELRCVVVQYLDFPTVEWTLYFENTGKADTPVLENIQALDVRLERGDAGEFLLHHSLGSTARPDDYQPLETWLGPGSTTRYAARGGRATDPDMPYYNLEQPGGEGLILVIGWPGQWAAEFARDDAKGLQIRAGQELTHFKLLPGEEVRTPLVVLQFWKGDWARSQNIWRRWMLAHNAPRPGGKPPAPQLLGSSYRFYGEMIGANEDNQKMFIGRYLEEGLKLDYWWMDAGWYVQEKGWPQTGTWEVDTKRFPGGLRAISDFAHARGVKILVWFEPERVAPGTWLYENHPEWILGAPDKQLLDLGNPEAWNWVVEHVDTLIVEQGIDLYRQDFNMSPLSHWRAHDAPDRQGITEIQHVTGYLAFWDELRRRHPNMLIDSCASGGRRNDLETMRRSVPLWTSDVWHEPVSDHSMIYGLSVWLPYHGVGTYVGPQAPAAAGTMTPAEQYAFWSHADSSLMCSIDVRVKGLDYETLRKLVGQWRQVNACYLGDFYPLTSHSVAHDVWIAWQFDRPEAGEGLIEAFRREQSVYESARLKLRGLDPDAQYELTRFDEDKPRRMTGRELMDDGLVVGIATAPGAAVYQYKKVNQRAS